jgi:hypothetical protein
VVTVNGESQTNNPLRQEITDPINGEIQTNKLLRFEIQKFQSAYAKTTTPPKLFNQPMRSEIYDPGVVVELDCGLRHTYRRVHEGPHALDALGQYPLIAVGGDAAAGRRAKHGNRALSATAIFAKYRLAVCISSKSRAALHRRRAYIHGQALALKPNETGRQSA